MATTGANFFELNKPIPLMLSLSVSAFTDLCVGLVVMPLNFDYYVHGEEWIRSKQVCVLWLLTDTIACTMSVWILVAIAVDRLVVSGLFDAFLGSLDTITCTMLVETLWQLLWIGLR